MVHTRAGLLRYVPQTQSEHLDRYVREIAGLRNLSEEDTIDIMVAVDLGVDGKRIRYEDLIRDNGLASGARGQAPRNGTPSTAATAWTGCSEGRSLREADRPSAPILGTINVASGGSSMKDARKPKPVTRPEPHRVEVVRPTCQPSRAELEEPIWPPQMSLEEATRRFMEPVETHHTSKPRRESQTGCSWAPFLILPFPNPAGPPRPPPASTLCGSSLGAISPPRPLLRTVPYRSSSHAAEHADSSEPPPLLTKNVPEPGNHGQEYLPAPRYPPGRAPRCPRVVESTGSGNAQCSVVLYR